MMARMPELSRRAILRLGVGAVGAYALGTAAPAAAAPTFATGIFVSAARGGVPTNWAIARPPGQTAPLRPIIALHGKGQSAAGVMAGGVEQGIGAGRRRGPAARRGRRRRRRWKLLAQAGVRRGLRGHGARRTDPDAGHAGDRHLARRISRLVDGRLRRAAARLPARRGPHRGDLRGQSRAVDVAGAAAPGAFDGAEDYAANSVWGRPELGSIPIRIDCGDGDPFSSATKQFIAHCPTRRRAASPPAATTAGIGVRSCPPRWRGWRRC